MNVAAICDHANTERFDLRTNETQATCSLCGHVETRTVALTPNAPADLWLQVAA